ncbi:hypothetical protein SCUP515_07223 [Seiridium cupressi]
MGETRRPGRPRKSYVGTPISTTIGQSQDRLPIPATVPDKTSALDVTLEDENTADGVDFLSPPTDLNDMDGGLCLVGVRNPASFNEFDFSDIFGGPAAEGTPGASKQSLPVLGMHQCLKELSDLNVELHAQWLGVSPKPGDSTLAPYICPEASYVKTSEFTILERALTAFQKFYGILSNVEWLLSRRAEGHETRDGANSEAETSSIAHWIHSSTCR